MKSNEFRKILAMIHIAMALLIFAVSVWQIVIVKDVASNAAMNSDSFYVLFRVLTLSGLLWAVALAICAVSLITEKRRTFCQLISAFNLFLFPIGTILGGLTLYALRIKQDNVSTIQA